eukprot:scaffold3718_cov131-Amphora_coffeaeformis.AAC.1
MVFDFEIVGLNSSTNGRSCCLHETCGEDVGIGEVLRLVPCVVSVDGSIEEAVKCVKVEDGKDSCTVVYVPWVIAKLPVVQDHLNKFVQVVQLYDYSCSKYKKEKLYKNCGMASVVILNEEGQNE